MWKISFVRRKERDRHLDEEIRAHFSMALRERIERGEDPDAAAAAVRREFGNRTLVEETTRAMWGGNICSVLAQDARYALRGMRRSPGFTAIAVASLALGIGANTAIFSLMNTVMLRLLPVRDPESLVEVLQKYPGEPRGGSWSWNSYVHYRDHGTVFSSLIGTSVDHLVQIQAEKGQPQRVIGEYVTDNYFRALGIEPALGRFIAPGDTAPDVAIVSWSCWTGLLHRDPAVIGQRIFVQRKPVTVIGVAPHSFVGLRIEDATDVWLPRPPASQVGTMLGRLKPGVTLAQALAEMRVLYRFTIEERSARSKDPLVRQLTVDLEPAGYGLATVRDRFGKPLVILMSVVALLLLIACVNIASLLLARGAGRQREFAVRLGLGASRGRLIRQVLTEALLLSILGTILGALVAYIGTAALTRMLASGRIGEQIYLRVQPDLHVLLFATALALLTGLLFGLAPAWNAFRSEQISSLRQTGGTSETRWKRLFGRSLVSTQVALSMLLLSLGTLFVAHLWNLEHAYLGFRRDHVLLVTLDPSSSGYKGPQLEARYQELLRHLKQVPGVRSVALCAPTPLSGAGASGFANVEGFEERPSDKRWISISYVTPQYLATIGSPLLAGREFNARDQVHPRVVIINQTMARHYFAGRDPIGQHVTLYHVTLDPQPKTYEIIGIAGNANYLDIREPARSAVYLPAFHDGVVSGNNVVLRTDIKPEGVMADVRRVVRDVMSQVPIARTTTLNAQIDASIVPERLVATLSGFFAVLGATLAVIGIYGLLAYTVARRTNEIGIRMALGATRSDMALLVVTDTVLTVLAGLLLGLPLALWSRSLALSWVQDLKVETALPVLCGTVILFAGALVASYLPARRAATVDPMAALRTE